MAHLEQLRTTALSYYEELQEIIDKQFPEIKRIHKPETLQEYSRVYAQRAATEYHQQLESDSNEHAAKEIARETLTAELGSSYFDEIAGILEEYPDVNTQLKALDDDVYIAFVAEIATRVYLDINGREKADEQLYYSPFKDGYNQAEEQKIKHATIKAYNGLSREAYDNAGLKGIDLLQS